MAKAPAWERFATAALAAAAMATFVAFKFGPQPGDTESKPALDPSARSAMATAGCRDDLRDEVKSSRAATP